MDTRGKRLPARLVRAIEERASEENILLFFCALMVVFVAPFAVVRALTGEWLHALTDLCAVVLGMGIGGYLWLTRDVRRTRHFAALAFTAGAVGMTYLFGTHILYWAYPACVALFFVLRPLPAVVYSTLVAIALVPAALQLGSPLGTAGFLATLAANDLFALIFATGMTRSRSRLRALAERDPLTGAGNRRMFWPALEAALERLERDGVPAALLAVDIDHFKGVNDAFGHDVGDQVLRDLTDLIRDSIRTGDQVFRYGGEELVILAEGARRNAAGRLAESLCARVRGIPFPQAGPITVSIGVAESEPADSPVTWFRRADASLYRAKRAGRDCVRLAGADETDDAHDADDGGRGADGGVPEPAAAR